MKFEKRLKLEPSWPSYNSFRNFFIDKRSLISPCCLPFSSSNLFNVSLQILKTFKNPFSPGEMDCVPNLTFKKIYKSFIWKLLINLNKTIPSVIDSEIAFLRQYENLTVTFRLHTNLRNCWICLLTWDIYSSSFQDSYNILELSSDSSDFNSHKNVSSYYPPSECLDHQSPRYYQISKHSSQSLG